MVRKLKRNKARRPQQQRQPELTAKQVEQRLLATSFPRLHMLLILALAALGTFLSSALLVNLGMKSMGLRYLLAVVSGYSYFLLFVRLWVAYQTRNWSFGRRTPGSSETKRSLDLNGELPDLSALGDLGTVGDAAFSGGGGEFGGAGASASFGDSALPACSLAPTSRPWCWRYLPRFSALQCKAWRRKKTPWAPCWRRTTTRP